MMSDKNFRSASSLTQGQKTQNMFINSDESLAQVGECDQHKRTYECFCVDCHILICPTCLMFGEHKGHNVSSMEESSRSLRSKMDEAARSGKGYYKRNIDIGILKLEKTENVLVDIRHTKLMCEESKQRVLKEVDAAFSQIFKLIKQRKEEVLSQVNQHFENENDKITVQEQQWIEKQDRGLELIKMAKSPNDSTILKRAEYILESINIIQMIIAIGLEILKKNPVYQNVNLVNSIDTNFSYAQLSLNFNEFKKALEKWIQLGETVLIQFKC